MNHAISITPRRLILVAFLALVAVSTYGFAATNNVDTSNAGDGNGDISGYDVTNVHYTLDSNNPSQVNQVSFDLSPAMVSGGTVRIAMNGGAFIAAPCTGTSPVTCDLSGASVTAASLGNLRVVAAQ